MFGLPRTRYDSPDVPSARLITNSHALAANLERTKRIKTPLGPNLEASEVRGLETYPVKTVGGELHTEVLSDHTIAPMPR
jgi:hypothetical protein